MRSFTPQPCLYVIKKMFFSILVYPKFIIYSQQIKPPSPQNYKTRKPKNEAVSPKIPPSNDLSEGN